MDVGLHLGAAIGVLAALLLFYGFVYSPHQDLAGSALTGRLAVTLGDSFRDYSVYFPPAERFWFSLAAQLSAATGARLDLTVVAMTGVMVLISAGLAYAIRRSTVGASPLFLLGSLAVLLVFPILFKNVFGLREHMVALGLWPYLVLRLSDPEGRKVRWRLRALLGLWMGVTLLFKYLYALVVLLVELADAAMQRRPPLLLRIENIVAGTLVAAYLFVWLVLDPSQRTAIGAMFSAIDANLADPATGWLKVGQNVLYAAGFVLLLRIFGAPVRLIVLAVATIAATVIVAWSQERWYTHHLFPIVLAYVMLWWAARDRFRLWGHAIMAIGIFYASIGHFLSTAQYQEQVAEVDRAIAGAGGSVAGKRVGILTMHPSPYNQYLAAHDGLRWNGLMNTAYLAAELKPFDTPGNAGKLPPPVTLEEPGRRMLHDQMLRLWEDMPPDVLILDDTYRWPLRHVEVDWLHAFSRDPRFNAILQGYRPALVHKGDRLSFTYYVRAD